MATPEDRDWGARTRACTPAARPDPTTGARAVPIYQTTSFVFEDVAGRRRPLRAAEVRQHLLPPRQPDRRGLRGARREPRGRHRRRRDRERPGGRDAARSPRCRRGRPRRRRAPRSTAGPTCCSTSRCAGSGSRRPSSRPTTPHAFAAAIQPGPHEAPLHRDVSNPAGTVADLEALADGGRTHAGVPLAVDSTLATPHLCRPLDHGADIVMHSATKFLGGHGTSLGGVVVDSGRFPWDNGNFPIMTEPVATYGNLRFWDNFGEYGFCTKLRVEGLRTLGGVLSPFNAFLLLHGMETLPLRMDAHVANAQAVAEWLAADRAGELGALRRAAGRPGPRAGRDATCPRGRARCSRSAWRAAGRRARRSSTRSSCARTSPTSATPGRSSSIPPPPRTASSPRRRSRRPACSPTSCGSASGSRTSTTSSSISTAALRRSAEAG